MHGNLPWKNTLQDLPRWMYPVTARLILCFAAPCMFWWHACSRSNEKGQQAAPQAPLLRTDMDTCCPPPQRRLVSHGERGQSPQRTRNRPPSRYTTPCLPTCTPHLLTRPSREAYTSVWFREALQVRIQVSWTNDWQPRQLCLQPAQGWQVPGRARASVCTTTTKCWSEPRLCGLHAGHRSAPASC